MLTDAFKKLLTIQEERLVEIRRDCEPFSIGDNRPAEIHRHVIDRVDDLLDATRNFRDAAPETYAERKQAFDTYKNAPVMAMDLANYLFEHSQEAGVFRNAALQKHGTLIHVIAREKVLTCVSTAWGLINEMLNHGREAQKLDLAPPVANRPKFGVIQPWIK